MPNIKAGAISANDIQAFGQPTRTIKIGVLPILISLAEVNLFDVPFSFEVYPDIESDPLTTIKVDVSFDSGSTWASVGTFSGYHFMRWVKAPSESLPTHLLIYLVGGTSQTSLFSIGY